MRDADGFPFDEWEGRAEALGGEAAAREHSAGGRAADSAAGGGAEARPRVSVVKGNYTAAPDHIATDEPELTTPAGLTGKLKRLLADRARALIAETCGDMPEADKLRSCGVHVRAGIEDVAIERHPNGYVYATGLQSCGSVWACPICSFKIRMKTKPSSWPRRSLRTRANGGTVMLLTLTTQHSFGETLDELWTQTQDTWSYITGHSRYRRLKLRLGLGFCRTMEVMFGLNGWHPHLHVVLFSDTPVDQFDDREIWTEIIVCFHDLWVNRMRNKYNRECRSSVAVDLRPVKDDGIDGVGVYCTKAGYEVAMADGKEGRTRTSRHPFRHRLRRRRNRRQGRRVAVPGVDQRITRPAHVDLVQGPSSEARPGRGEDRRGAGGRGRRDLWPGVHRVAETVASHCRHSCPGCGPSSWPLSMPLGADLKRELNCCGPTASALWSNHVGRAHPGSASPTNRGGYDLVRHATRRFLRPARYSVHRHRRYCGRACGVRWHRRGDYSRRRQARRSPSLPGVLAPSTPGRSASWSDSAELGRRGEAAPRCPRCVGRRRRA